MKKMLSHPMFWIFTVFFGPVLVLSYEKSSVVAHQSTGAVTDTAFYCKTNAQCDDSNICTSDFCDFSHGLANAKCVNSVNPHVVCDDGDTCTTDDVCDVAKKCVGKPIVCDDGNPFTNDYCDHRAGCTFSIMGSTDCETVILKQYGVL